MKTGTANEVFTEEVDIKGSSRQVKFRQWECKERYSRRKQ